MLINLILQKLVLRRFVVELKGFRRFMPLVIHFHGRQNDSLNFKMSHRAKGQSDAPRFSPRISHSERYLLRGHATPFALHEQVF